MHQKYIYESHKMLRTHKCINGNKNEQFQILLEKSKKMASLTRKAKLNKKQAWIEYG
jgi:hypothetical protein